MVHQNVHDGAMDDEAHAEVAAGDNIAASQEQVGQATQLLSSQQLPTQAPTQVPMLLSSNTMWHSLCSTSEHCSLSKV